MIITEKRGKRIYGRELIVGQVFKVPNEEIDSPTIIDKNFYYVLIDSTLGVDSVVLELNTMTAYDKEEFEYGFHKRSLNETPIIVFESELLIG